MNEIKINQAELVDLLTQHDEFSERNAEKFLIELKNLAQEALLRDQILKVPNIGTFKLAWAEGRKSIDVRTGQEINIAGHYKLTFAPDAALKERTNVTIESSEPKEIPLQRLSQQAEEIRSMLTGLNDKKEEEQVVVVEPVEQPEPEPEVQEEVKEEPQIEVVEVVPPVTPEPAVEPEKKEEEVKPVVIEPKIKEPKAEEPKAFNPYIPQEPEQPAEAADEPEERKKHGWIWILIILLLLAIGAIIYFFYFDLAKAYCDDVCNWYKSKFKTEQVQVEEPTSVDAAEVDEMFDDSVEPETAESVPEIFSQPRDYSKTITRVTIKKGIYLAILADKYYGHKDFWVYLYEANRNVLAHPNGVEVGMVIRIPKLDNRLVNANDAYAVEFAQKLGNQYLK